MFDALLLIDRMVFIEDSVGSIRDSGRMTDNPYLTACLLRPESPCRRGPLDLASGKIGLHRRQDFTVSVAG